MYKNECLKYPMNIRVVRLMICMCASLPSALLSDLPLAHAQGQTNTVVTKWSAFNKTNVLQDIVEAMPASGAGMNVDPGTKDLVVLLRDTAKEISIGKLSRNDSMTSLTILDSVRRSLVGNHELYRNKNIILCNMLSQLRTMMLARELSEYSADEPIDVTLRNAAGSFCTFDMAKLNAHVVQLSKGGIRPKATEPYGLIIEILSTLGYLDEPNKSLMQSLLKASQASGFKNLPQILYEDNDVISFIGALFGVLLQESYSNVAVSIATLLRDDRVLSSQEYVEAVLSNLDLTHKKFLLHGSIDPRSKISEIRGLMGLGLRNSFTKQVTPNVWKPALEFYSARLSKAFELN